MATTTTFEHWSPRPARDDGHGRADGGSGGARLRIRDSDGSSYMASNKSLRRSVFREEGLDDLNTSVHIIREGESAPDIGPPSPHIHSSTKASKAGGVSSKLGTVSGPGLGGTKAANSSTPGPAFTTLPRAALMIMLIAMVVPGFRYGSDSNGNTVSMPGVEADVIRSAEMVDNGALIEGRAESPTDTCTRWAHQVANVNGTVYIYGGEAKQMAGQSTDTWNNNLLSLDLTKTWNRATPSLTGLTQPSGPPAVALGTLWHSYTSLFLYGGEFADNPSTSPLPVSTWEYNIGSKTWTEWAAPVTSAGNHSDLGGQPVQRSAEGAGISVPELGRSWYFGGHLDMYTTAGWSNQIARVYLKSLLEFTHPGYANSGVSELGDTIAAGSGGVYRNITEGGIQDDAGFTERADGVLIYVPGWSASGILLGLAGGTNESFTEMNTIDVYDIANSTWYKQATSGPNPPIRVNPCAVVAAASDGTSFNVYLYGGQNLIPYDQQVQYSDMWILTIPSFTWTQVVMDGQSQPPARAGHTCTMWDGQMVVVGGYVGTDISCDSPGIYIFNASSLQWTNSFTSLSGSDIDYDDQGSSVLQGSVGYQVPAQVQSIIGGNAQGGATVSTPASGPASLGPFATGRSPVFTVTQPGTTVIQTAGPTSTSPSSIGTGKEEKKGTNTGAVAAGVVAGALACIALYLAFCTWLYRRRVKMYQDHMKMAQRSSFGTAVGIGGAHGDGEWSSDIDAELSTQSTNNNDVILGPFGTAIGRRSGGSEPSSGSGGYGGGYGPVKSSNGDEEISYGGVGGHRRQTSAATQSLVGSVGSREDLLGGQEPSFFSVVLNPRQTLRVVNHD